MGDMLSQEEINALFNPQGAIPPEADEPEEDESYKSLLTEDEKGVLGEVGNISMGTAASTLSTLLSQRVDITTPNVKVQKWTEVAKSYDRPCVGVRVDYVEGLEGVSVLVLKERDVKIISDLMMGGDGLGDPTGSINELDLSAITECMNQMIGSSSTSLSSLIKTKIDIDTPQSFKLDFNDDQFFKKVEFVGDMIVAIRFRMEIGNLIDSEIMQIWPIDFAKHIVEIFMREWFNAPPPHPPVDGAPPRSPDSKPLMDLKPAPAPPPAPQQPAYAQQSAQAPPPPITPPPPDPAYADGQPGAYPPGQPPYPYPPYTGQPYPYPPPGYYPPPPQQAPQTIAYSPKFENFDFGGGDEYSKENIALLKDVPLDVTVELGRTTKKIKEILEFQPGSIVELNKLAGEPTDILINGKFVARGEVVVIDENFAVRITDIINPENRI
ncbi:MAG: flagellar motor switch phosphatase FliY [Clostridiales bacterium]|jgi:flagellar motor switch protein FliN/FliY|nr:flagellar motor switch phosphatase FliY [Clostridiales bacterium]